MKLEKQLTFDAPVDDVFALVDDVDALASCIPGLEELRVLEPIGKVDGNGDTSALSCMGWTRRQTTPMPIGWAWRSGRMSPNDRYRSAFLPYPNWPKAWHWGCRSANWRIIS